MVLIEAMNISIGKKYGIKVRRLWLQSRWVYREQIFDRMSIMFAKWLLLLVS